MNSLLESSTPPDRISYCGIIEPTGNVTQMEGPVGFFDILGYKSFLATENPFGPGVVLDIISTAKEAVIEKALLLCSRESPAEAQLRSFQWLVFSDTILITAPESLPKDAKFLVLSHIASILMRHMFTKGLPLRGAITDGLFWISKTNQNCFAGRPIVEAHDLVARIDASICVIHPNTVANLKDTIKGRDHNGLFLEYNVPIKNHDGNRDEMLYTISPSMPDLDSEVLWHDTDIRQLVTDSFWAHRKQLRQDDLPKVTNTEMYLRYVKTRAKEAQRDFR